MFYVALTKARATLAQLIESERMSVITKQGQPVSVLMSFDAFRALRADLQTFADPDIAGILSDHAQAVEGDVEGLEEFVPRDGRGKDAEVSTTAS